MCKMTLFDFLAELPKCEHHIHLEGCLSPKLVFKLAAKNNIRLPLHDPSYKSPEELERRYEHFKDLEDFLQYHYRAMAVLVTRDDFEMLGWEYFTNAHRDGVRHAEVFFDPQSHTSRNVPFAEIVTGYNAACVRAEKELGITSCLIMCFLRHLPISSAAETMRSARDGGYLQLDDQTSAAEGARPVISALGLDSSEVGFRPELFEDIFREAERLGVHRTAHAGEEGDTTYIKGALDSLLVERIDHGVRLPEDEELLRRVAREGIMLTVCPLSNLCLGVVEKIEQLPVRTFLNAGVRFSINSDDPAYFRGYVLESYYAIQSAFNLRIEEWKWIAESSIHGSWVSKRRKSELLAILDACVEKYSS
jgi:adenosine deaminase